MRAARVPAVCGTQTRAADSLWRHRTWRGGCAAVWAGWDITICLSWQEGWSRFMLLYHIDIVLALIPALISPLWGDFGRV